jgi:hypothetical protein
MNEGRKAYRIPAGYLLAGYQNNRSTVTSFFQNAGTWIGECVDSSTPVVSEDVVWLKDEMHAARKKGVKLLYLTDITTDNLSACRSLMNAVTELRHMDGLVGNFGVSDSECLSVSTVTEGTKIEEIRFLYSDSEDVVKQLGKVFDTLWTHSTPAHARIDELEYEIKHKEERIIDRIYICKQCDKSFVFLSEVDDHKNETGHTNFSEFPLSS